MSLLKVYIDEPFIDWIDNYRIYVLQFIFITVNKMYLSELKDR